MTDRLILLVFLILAACGGGSGDGGNDDDGNDVPAPLPRPASTFVNWENLSVHPVDVTPDGKLLCVCNTPDNRLELFDLSGPVPVPVASIAVGLDPVSVRVRSNSEVWVANHVSDSVSVVDLPTRRVVETLATLDEPADIVFAGAPQRAFVSCSQANAIQVFNPDDLGTAPVVVAIDAEDPRALAVSADGSEVYAAIFESGNGTTSLGGGADSDSAGSRIGFPPNVVSDTDGPHAGVNPPPNDGAAFDPPQRPGNPAPPPVGLIVKRDDDGAWRDDTGADWTRLVSGDLAARSGRRPGWDLVDRDVAILDTATLTVRYAKRCLNVCAAIAVQPGTGRVTIVGTDATNEVRFEPVLNGRFLRVRAVGLDPAAPDSPSLVDLNPHLDYTGANVPQAQRDLSVGDPRGIAWLPDGSRAFVTGMGSNNVAVLGAALAVVARIEVGEGPTGIAIAPGGARAYVLNRFAGSVSVIDTVTLTEVALLPLFDPTPQAIKRGRRHLYDTHATSGLGHTACASCHVDARMDRLAWDLGDPSGAVKPFNQICITDLIALCEDFHPMKGPMLTQTLQDIIGKEPHHWRGDREGIEAFDGAFLSLLGDDAGLTTVQMQEFEDFLATIVFPPNPFRNLDNTLPADLALPGHFSPGRFGPEGEPLPNGDAVEGLRLYRRDSLDGGVAGFQCVTCHTLPTGMGPDRISTPNGTVSPAPLGPNGERHHGLVSVDGSTNVSLKIPQLRNLYERVGFETTRLENRAGFGFVHDGSIDSIARFVAEPVFDITSRQEIADLVAFMLCFSGSDLPQGSTTDIEEPAGPPSLDTHAAVGKQTTFGARRDEAMLASFVTLAASAVVDLVAKSADRGWFYDRTLGLFQSDRNGETASLDALRALATPGSEITFTVVPRGSGHRIGVDRDDDGFGDTTEREFGSDPADAADVPR